MARLDVTGIVHSFIVNNNKNEVQLQKQNKPTDSIWPVFAPVSLVLRGHWVAVQGTETNPISTFKTRETIKINFIVAKETGVKVAATTVLYTQEKYQAK